jgi:sec-independent protein translocase protein TatC
MATAVRAIANDQRLPLVDHLEELRMRLIICLAALAVAFGLCLWQNHLLLSIVNAPLAHETQQQVRAGQGPLGETYAVEQGARTVAVQMRSLLSVLERPTSGLSAPARAALAHSQAPLSSALARLSRAPQGNKPVTLGVGEPFMTTIGIALLFAFIIALPVILYELYGFLLPALSRTQQRVATPLLVAVPALFTLGALFGYLVVLPAAVHFFESFNSSEFNVLVQASQYYHFVALIVIAMGLVFQVPVAILAATRAGVVSARTLRRNRRYALLGCGLVAALLPGDAITLALETVPLYLLFELSLVLATAAERLALRRERQATADAPGR